MFTVWLTGREWLIRMAPLPSQMRDSAARYHEVGTDGTNVYSLSVLNPDFDQEAAKRRALKQVDELIQRAGTPSSIQNLQKAREDMQQRITSKPRIARASNQAVGEVLPFHHPEFSYAHYAPLVWVAYCSEIYLDAESDQEMPQIWPYENPMQAMATNMLRVHVDRSTEPPRLPERVIFFNDGTGFDALGTNLVRRPLPPPFNHGYTNAVYEALAFTNVQNHLLPLRFSLTSYRRRADARKSSDLSVLARYDGVMTFVRSQSGRGLLVPDLPVPTRIHDRRTRVQYLAQPGAWVRTTNKEQVMAHEREVLAALHSDTKRRGASVRVVLAFGALVGLLLLFRAWKARART